MKVHQGDCVNLDSDDDTYQVIGVDGDHDRCWVRRWPLQSNCLLYTSPSPRDKRQSRMPSSA